MGVGSQGHGCCQNGLAQFLLQSEVLLDVSKGPGNCKRIWKDVEEIVRMLRFMGGRRIDFL